MSAQLHTATRLIVGLGTLSLVAGYPVLHLKLEFLKTVLQLLAP